MQEKFVVVVDNCIVSLRPGPIEVRLEESRKVGFLNQVR
jgi:hypothetical protein